MKTPWKRQYAALLLLFCLILNGSILTFGVLRYDRAYRQAKEELRACGEKAADILSSSSVPFGYYTSAWEANGIAIACGTSWYNVYQGKSGSWEPPVDALSQSEKRDVILRGRFDGNDCLCYALYSTGASESMTYYLLYDLSPLQKEQTYLTAVACGVGLVFSVLFAFVLAGAMKKVTALSPVEEEIPAEAEVSPFAHAPEQDLSAHCRALVARFEELAEERGVILAGSAAPHCTVRCEADKLSALTEALLTVAIAATPRGEKVSLLVTRQTGAVTLRITHGGAWRDTATARLSLLAADVGASLVAVDNTVTVRWEEAVS